MPYNRNPLLYLDRVHINSVGRNKVQNTAEKGFKGVKHFVACLKRPYEREIFGYCHPKVLKRRSRHPSLLAHLPRYRPFSVRPQRSIEYKFCKKEQFSAQARKQTGYATLSAHYGFEASSVILHPIPSNSRERSQCEYDACWGEEAPPSASRVSL